MSDLNDNRRERARAVTVLARMTTLLALVYLTALAVAAFAFTVSYSHIYDLGAAHAQSGTAARMLPLSVDVLIVAASLVMFIRSQGGQPETTLARVLPPVVLYGAIGATVAANVAYGLPHGWLAAVISGWPGAAFVGVVEMITHSVRPGSGAAPEAAPRAVVTAGQGAVPANPVEAAKAAYAASRAGGNPLSAYKLQQQWKIPRSVADKIVSAPVGEPSMNGSGPGA